MQATSLYPGYEAHSWEVAMASTVIGKQAVVIGAGMAGLTAAGALSDHFDQVVVLERDTLPSEPAHRAGTPQARHVHALLLSGQRALSELFPGFEQDLARAGAVPLRVGLDLRMERFGIPDDAPTDWKGVMTFGQAPQDSRGGLMLPLEGNRWMITIGGRHGDVPPGDVEGF